MRELARGARGERALGERDVVVGAVEGAEHAPVLLVADVLGEVLDRACRRSATLISCMPRQIPSTGRSRSIAARVSAISNASRSGTVSTVCGCALVAVAGGVDVGAAGEHQAVEQLERLVGLGRRAAASGGSISAIAAGALHAPRCS